MKFSIFYICLHLQAVLILCKIPCNHQYDDALTDQSFNNSLRASREDVVFRLWNRAGIHYISYGKLDEARQYFNTQKPFKVLVHGFKGGFHELWLIPMTEQYLKVQDYNIIQVDWGKLAAGRYFEVVPFVKDVGYFIADLIINIHDILGISYNSFHIIGHSLGAHVAGFASKKVKSTGGGRIGRITALDPAGIKYEQSVPSSEKLSNTDASFVDAIHTDGLKFGMLYEIGNIDFYPNSGVAPQPGCFFYRNVYGPLRCSHDRSIYYYIESIISNLFIAQQCTDGLRYSLGHCNDNAQTILGENVDMTKRGSFYLSTNPGPPYARAGQY